MLRVCLRKDVYVPVPNDQAVFVHYTAEKDDKKGTVSFVKFDPDAVNDGSQPKHAQDVMVLEDVLEAEFEMLKDSFHSFLMANHHWGVFCFDRQLEGIKKEIAKKKEQNNA